MVESLCLPVIEDMWCGVPTAWLRLSMSPHSRRANLDLPATPTIMVGAETVETTDLRPTRGPRLGLAREVRRVRKGERRGLPSCTRCSQLCAAHTFPNVFFQTCCSFCRLLWAPDCMYKWCTTTIRLYRAGLALSGSGQKGSTCQLCLNLGLTGDPESFIWLCGIQFTKRL